MTPEKQNFELPADFQYEAPQLEEFNYSKLARVRGASGCDALPGGGDTDTDFSDSCL